jgi:hypothetical protein
LLNFVHYNLFLILFGNYCGRKIASHVTDCFTYGPVWVLIFIRPMVLLYYLSWLPIFWSFWSKSFHSLLCVVRWLFIFDIKSRVFFERFFDRWQLWIYFQLLFFNILLRFCDVDLIFHHFLAHIRLLFDFILWLLFLLAVTFIKLFT